MVDGMQGNETHRGWLGRFAQKNMPSLLRPGFRSYWSGQFISAIGAWMQSLALSWAALQLSPSPIWLGIFGFAQYFPMLLLTLPAGAIADRVRKRYMLIITQSSLTVLALLLALIFFLKIESYPLLLVAAFINGTLMSFDMPARHVFIGELVPREELRNAVAFNSTSFNVARIIGPLVAGVVMGAVGSAWCFVLNALSFIPFISAVFFSRGGRTKPEKSGTSIFKELIEGLKYIGRHKILLRVSVIAFITMTMVTNYNVLVPLTARDSLGLGETGYGVLMVWLGIGAIAGSLFTAMAHKTCSRKNMLESACLAACVTTAMIGFMGNYIITAISLVLAGFTFAVFTSMTNAQLQDNAEEQFRGRAVSIYSFIVGGTTPLGNLIAGSFAEMGTPWFSWVMCAAIGVVLIAAAIVIFSVHRNGQEKIKQKAENLKFHD
jgi:MFS family permease